jgi:hypothetical protein
MTAQINYRRMSAPNDEYEDGDKIQRDSSGHTFKVGGVTDTHYILVPPNPNEPTECFPKDVVHREYRRNKRAFDREAARYADDSDGMQDFAEDDFDPPQISAFRT